MNRSAATRRVEDPRQQVLDAVLTLFSERGYFATTVQDISGEPLVMDFMLYAKHKEFLPEEKSICSSKPFELMRTIVAAGMESGEIRRMDVMGASTSLLGGPLRMSG